MYLAQKAFNNEHARGNIFSIDGGDISLNRVQQAYVERLRGNLSAQDRVRLHEGLVSFEAEAKMGYNSLSSMYDRQYQAAKREVGNSRAVVPLGGLKNDSRSSAMPADAKVSGLDFSVAGLRDAYGRSVIQTTSLQALKDSFNTHFRRFSLYAHPDKGGDPVAFQTLKDWQEWVNNLTEEEFRRSPK